AVVRLLVHEDVLSSPLIVLHRGIMLLELVKKDDHHSSNKTSITNTTVAILIVLPSLAGFFQVSGPQAAPSIPPFSRRITTPTALGTELCRPGSQVALT